MEKTFKGSVFSKRRCKKWKTTEMSELCMIRGFPGSSAGEECPCNAGDPGSIPGSGRSPGGRAWQPTPVFLPGEFPRTEEPGGLQSMRLQRVGHDWAQWQGKLMACDLTLWPLTFNCGRDITLSRGSCYFLQGLFWPVSIWAPKPDMVRTTNDEV